MPDQHNVDALRAAEARATERLDSLLALEGEYPEREWIADAVQRQRAALWEAQHELVIALDPLSGSHEPYEEVMRVKLSPAQATPLPTRRPRKPSPPRTPRLEDDPEWEARIDAVIDYQAEHGGGRPAAFKALFPLAKVPNRKTLKRWEDRRRAQRRPASQKGT